MPQRDTGGRVVVGASNAFAAAPILNAVAYLAGQAAGVQNAQQGVSEYRSTRVSASVTLGQLQPQQKFASPSVMQRAIRVLVVLYYRIEGAESGAEGKLGSAVDSFTVLFYQARPTELYGTLRQMVLDASAADDPSYQIAAGQEVRVYPLVITGVQQQQI